MNIPKPNGAFAWTQETWGSALRCTAIAAPHLFSTRALELRGVTGQPAEGWNQLAVALGVRQGKVLRPRQVHGDAVTVVSTLPADPSDVCATAADIVMTAGVDVALAVQTADCVPLLLADSRTGAVAAAHAGWRGTAAGVARTAVRAMEKHFGTRAADLVVAIGPSIGPCCYRVGDEVLAAFGADGRRWFYRVSDGLMLNLWRANQDQLAEAGVNCDRIHVAELCTAMDADLFHSYRRDGQNAGRLAAAIRRAPGTTP
jgi:purine-nucleoside/S-methyl-5'-thioadenosine phosphorylase / adenosine deaminase